MTSVVTLKSAYRMHCFSCNKPIEKGEEITQCLESGGMNLRRRSFISARWVHQFCVPTPHAHSLLFGGVGRLPTRLSRYGFWRY